MMIALRSLLLALLGSYAIASSTERKLRSVPVAATTIQVPPVHLVGDHSGRRTQSCDALLATVQSCTQAFPGCGSCIDDTWDTLPEEILCSVFEEAFCDAIYEDCNCGTCTDELEDYFECVALTGGCSSFECPVPVPDPDPVPVPSEECTLSDFSTLCSNLGQNLEPACVVAL